MSESIYELKSVPAEWGGVKIEIGGRIDSNDSSNFEKEIFAMREASPEGSLTLDVNDLEYISSSGLRVFLKLQKSEKSTITIVQANDMIYGVLDSTGFNRIFNVKKKLREFDISNCEEIARGSTGKVYKVDDDTIIKVFNEGSPISFAEEEQSKSKIALISGVPTAISYEIVTCGDKYGVLFEMVKASTASKIIKEAKEEDVPMWGRKLGDLMKSIHNCEADVKHLRSFKDIYIERIKTLGKYITKDQMDAIISALQTVPDRYNMLHGDFHVKNIMLQDGEFLLIDMIDIGYGHPIFDLSMNGISSRFYLQDSEMILGLNQERALTVWENQFREYFGTDDEAILAPKRDMIKAFMCPRLILFPYYVPGMQEEYKRWWVNEGLKLLPEFLEVAPNVDKIFE